MSRQHRQSEIWSEAFEANRRVWVGLYALIGLLALSFALNIVQAGRPAHVILVDKLGQGFFYPESASPEPAQDYEAKHFAQIWLALFLSRDAVTAKDDLAKALTLTHPALQQKLHEKLVASGQLEKLRDAFVHTTIRCNEVTIARQSDERLEVEVAGSRVFTALDSTRKQLSEPFRFHLVLEAVARTENTPNGLVVRYITGRWGADEAVDEKDARQPG